tara:strand:- start:9609 stop:10349 length:741 start_codon:yes stop_codon:yes gene_type:complete
MIAPICTRGLMDRASVFGTEGWGFESLRVHYNLALKGYTSYPDRQDGKERDMFLMRFMWLRIVALVLFLEPAHAQMQPMVTECVQRSVGGVLAGTVLPSSIVDIPKLTYRVLGGGWKYRVPQDITPQVFLRNMQKIIARALDGKARENRVRFKGLQVVPQRAIETKKDVFRITGSIFIPSSDQDSYGGWYRFQVNVRVELLQYVCTMYSFSIEGFVTLRSLTRSLPEVRNYLRQYGMIDGDMILNR